jgi:hypothetical protein
MSVLLATFSALVLFSIPFQDQIDSSTNILEKINQRLTTFYQSPTQDYMDELSQVLVVHSDKVTLGNAIGVFSAVVLGCGSRKFNLEIKQSGPVFDAAKEIAENNEESPLVRMLNDNEKINRMRLDTWWYSFFATGDTRYLELLLQQTGNVLSDDFKGNAKAALMSNGSFMNYAADHEKVAQFCRSSIDNNKGTWRESLLRTCVAFNKVKPINDNKFDRSTPEGALRLFFLGMMTGDEDLIRTTIYPINQSEFAYLNSGVSDRVVGSEVHDMVAQMKYERLKAGSIWKMPNSTEMKVPPKMDSDRGVTAYLGPRSRSPIPLQIMKFYGQWWVQPDAVIAVRKAAEKIRNENKGE